MQTFTFGVAGFFSESIQRGVQFAKLAEDLGFHKLWVGDSHMIWREVYVALGAIAMATKRIQIGPGVTHPELRHPTVTASAMATLNELSEGRTHLGIGIGATGPGNIGMKPVSLSRLEETIRLVRRLLAGEAVQLGDKTIQCVYASSASIPIYVAASSPRTREMAARVADGIVCGGAVTEMDKVVESLRRVAAEGGRDSREVKIMCWAPCSVAEDPVEAIEAVKGMVARTVMVTMGRKHRRGELQGEEEQRAVERQWKEYNMYHHMGPQHSHLVREQWVDQFAIAGTPDQVREKVRTIIRSGVDEIGIVPFGKSKESVVKMFAQEVMEKL